MPDATYVGAGTPCGNCGNPLTPGQPHKCGRTPEQPTANPYRKLDDEFDHAAEALTWDEGFAAGRAAAPAGERITHGRHCICSACAAEDWTNPQLAPCGMHGSSCPREYAPLGPAGRAAATPDPPNANGTVWMLFDSVGNAIDSRPGPASPDERLREAGEKIAWGLRHSIDGAKVLGDAPDEPLRFRDDLDGHWLHSVGVWLAEWAVALAAADRDKPSHRRSGPFVAQDITEKERAAIRETAITVGLDPQECIDAVIESRRPPVSDEPRGPDA